MIINTGGERNKTEPILVAEMMWYLVVAGVKVLTAVVMSPGI
jgi:hypothetical protein